MKFIRNTLLKEGRGFVPRIDEKHEPRALLSQEMHAIPVQGWGEPLDRPVDENRQRRRVLPDRNEHRYCCPRERKAECEMVEHGRLAAAGWPKHNRALSGCGRVQQPLVELELGDADSSKRALAGVVVANRFDVVLNGRHGLRLLPELLDGKCTRIFIMTAQECGRSEG